MLKNRGTEIFRPWRISLGLRTLNITYTLPAIALIGVLGIATPNVFGGVRAINKAKIWERETLSAFKFRLY